MILACLSLVLATLIAAQKDTVVFVHGLAGWGPDELKGLGYWGGYGKTESNQVFFNYFRNKGFRVIEASVGPLSSAHDRACELFAQLKCRRVDYGKAHAAFYSAGGGGASGSMVHQRFGKDYAAMGTKCPGFGLTWTGTNPIHFIGHSFGGNTIRYLEMLLQEGLASETGSDVSELFKPAAQKTGGGNWIRTLTTIATPHDGSTLTSVLGTGLVNTLKDVVGFAAAASDYFGVDALYDFDLGHFGLSHSGYFQTGDSFKSFALSVLNSPFFSNGFRDTIAWDLSPLGCQINNAKGKQAYSGTYYFAYSTAMTYRKLGTTGWQSEGHNVPLTIDVVMGPIAGIIGQLDPSIGRKVCEAGLTANSAYGILAGGCFDGTTWEPSDGVVPTFSSKGPHVGYPNSKSGYTAPAAWGTSFVTGRWYTRETRLSHLQVIGTPVLCLRTFGCKPETQVYEPIANTISTLCTGGSCSAATLEDEEIESIDVAKEKEDYMSTVVADFVWILVGLGVATVLSIMAVVGLIVKRKEVKEVAVRVGSGAFSRVSGSFERIKSRRSGSMGSPMLAIRKTAPASDIPELPMISTDDSVQVDNPVFKNEISKGNPPMRPPEV